MIKSLMLGMSAVMDDSVMDTLVKSGFEAIDFGFSNDFFVGDFIKNAEKIKARLEKYRIVCPQVHLPYYGIFTSSESHIEEKEKMIKEALIAMSILGASWGALHPMSATNFGYDHARALHDNVEHIKKYLDTAEKYGVGIALENLPVFPDCPQYDFFTSVPEEHLEVIKQVGSDRLGICWDFGHANLMKYDHGAVMEMMAPYIKSVHVHNNFTDRDLHLCPTIGTVDFTKLLPILIKGGYKGPLALEINLQTAFDKCDLKYVELCGKAACEIDREVSKLL